MITVFLVRHADIDLPPVSDSDDPPLNSAGRARADVLAHMVRTAAIEAIFTSSFARTKQTAEPLAKRLGLEPREAPSPAVLATEVLSGTAGAVILIVGHSNTVPQIIAALGATLPTIGHREFDNLFVATVAGSNETGLIHLKYGKQSA